MSTQSLADDLLELLRRVQQLSHPVRRGEISPEQYWLLRRLARAGTLTVGALAEQLGVSQSATTVACQRLERQGLVVRWRDPEDERVVQVALTPSGKDRIDAWTARKRAIVHSILSCLTPEEQDQLGALLVRIRQRAEELIARGDRRRG